MPPQLASAKAAIASDTPSNIEEARPRFVLLASGASTAALEA
ncbi:MAG TPA: hypothetical protein VMD06_05290 [Steroidobacteraceae bacterium]|nr:hypothetical protein [Steroidobacteraceae bacterium]